MFLSSVLLFRIMFLRYFMAICEKAFVKFRVLDVRLEVLKVSNVVVCMAPQIHVVMVMGGSTSHPIWTKSRRITYFPSCRLWLLYGICRCSM